MNCFAFYSDFIQYPNHNIRGGNRMYKEQAILIVDDELRTINGISTTLKRQEDISLEILTAKNGVEALNILQEKEIYLMLLDIKMPELDGLSLLKKMEKEDMRVTTILLTGHAEFEYARSAIRLNVFNYLLKPINKDILIKEVRRGLEHNRENLMLEKGFKMVESYPDLFEESKVSSNNPMIKEAINYINNNLSRTLSLENIAKYVCLNESYFSALFKEEMEITFSDYLTQVRIKKAKQLLIENKLRVYEIADKVGYHSSKYFIKVFHEQVGVTPNNYRNKF